MYREVGSGTPTYAGGGGGGRGGCRLLSPPLVRGSRGSGRIAVVVFHFPGRRILVAVHNDGGDLSSTVVFLRSLHHPPAKFILGSLLRPFSSSSSSAGCVAPPAAEKQTQPATESPFPTPVPAAPHHEPYGQRRQAAPRGPSPPPQGCAGKAVRIEPDKVVLLNVWSEGRVVQDASVVVCVVIPRIVVRFDLGGRGGGGRGVLISGPIARRLPLVHIPHRGLHLRRRRLDRGLRLLLLLPRFHPLLFLPPPPLLFLLLPPLSLLRLRDRPLPHPRHSRHSRHPLLPGRQVPVHVVVRDPPRLLLEYEFLELRVQFVRQRVRRVATAFATVFSSSVVVAAIDVQRFQRARQRVGVSDLAVARLVGPDIGTVLDVLFPVVVVVVVVVFVFVVFVVVFAVGVGADLRDWRAATGRVVVVVIVVVFVDDTVRPIPVRDPPRRDDCDDVIVFAFHLLPPRRGDGGGG